jgi:hypothetical protein
MRLRFSASMLSLMLSAGAFAAGSGVRQEDIFDPVFKLNAFTATVPADWKFDGVFVPGTSCSEIPYPVVRTYSPDGLTEVRRLPRLDWRWSDSKFAAANNPDCLDLKQEMSAQEFIKYLAGVLQVNYIRDVPVKQQLIDAEKKQTDQLNAMSATQAKQVNLAPLVRHGELAAALAEYRNGSFTIEENIFAQVECIRTRLGPMSKGTFSESCNATVRMVRAPKGQLDAALAKIDTLNVGLTSNPEWISRYMQYQNQRSQAIMNQMNAQSRAIMQQRQADFEHAQAMRAQQHQQFMATMQAGTDRALANARAVANSNHAIAQDWVDYALDRQTVTGPGGTVKVSSAYTQTWTNGNGQYYQTNNPNANPNGVLPGNWSQTQQVHGDGSAK